MKIRIGDIKENGISINTVRDAEWLVNLPELQAGGGDTRLKSDIDVELQVEKVLREVHVSGCLKYTISTRCARCLEFVDKELRPEINLILSPGDKLEETDKDLDHELYETEEIDISNYIREQIAISLPFKVICEESCKGLCSNCGTNLNTGECRCDNDWVDPRFAILKNIKV